MLVLLQAPVSLPVARLAHLPLSDRSEPRVLLQELYLPQVLLGVLPPALPPVQALPGQDGGQRS